MIGVHVDMHDGVCACVCIAGYGIDIGVVDTGVGVGIVGGVVVAVGVYIDVVVC